jgi:hypothetical protein
LQHIRNWFNLFVGCYNRGNLKLTEPQDIKEYLNKAIAEVKVEKRRMKEKIIQSVLSIFINAYRRKISTNIAEARQIDNLLSNTPNQTVRNQS